MKKLEKHYQAEDDGNCIEVDLEHVNGKESATMSELNGEFATPKSNAQPYDTKHDYCPGILQDNNPCACSQPGNKQKREDYDADIYQNK